MNECGGVSTARTDFISLLRRDGNLAASETYVLSISVIKSCLPLLPFSSPLYLMLSLSVVVVLLSL